tara:strand:- start:4176 stop:7754 length:3579 start_codon:yes stop_codon:yes gene_type:complete
MFVYTLRSRDGQVRRVTTEKKLTTEELEELDYRLFEDISMTPGDIVRGAKANVSDLFFSAGELLTDFSAGAAEKEQALTYVTPGARQVIAELEPEYKTASSLAEFERQSELREISNSIREARIEAREEITAPTPLRVQESFGYQAADAITQLGSQLALAGAGTLVAGPAGAAASLAGGIIPLGYTIGKDDYYRSIGKTPSTATVEEQQTAESVGTINAINTYALNTVGIRGIQRAFLKNKKINKKFFKLAEEGKLTKDSIKDITKDIGKAALGEGFTEAADEASLNILANSLFGYDPERETLEGTGKALALGAIGGGAFGTVASTGRIGRQLPAIPLKSISNATKAVSGVSKSLAEGTLKARDMVRNAPLTANILDGLMKRGIDVSKVTETISKKVVPVTKDSIESLKNHEIFKKVKSVFDDVARPIESKISSINENIGRILKTYSYDEIKRKNDFAKRVNPFLEKLRVIQKENPEDYKLIKEGWHKSNNSEALAPLMEKYNLTQEFQAFRQALNSILIEARAEGVRVGEIEDYLPRFVTNYEGLIKSLGIKTDENLMEIFLERRKNPEEEVSLDEAAEFLEKYILEQLKNSGKDRYKGIGTNPQKNRIIDNVSTDNVQYYADPIEATIAYVNRLATSVTDKQFLRGSKELDRNEFRNIEDSDILEQEFANASSIIVRSVYDENLDRRLSPTVTPDRDVDTRMRGKVSQNGLPLVMEVPFNINGVPIRFESNVDKALYVLNKIKTAQEDPSLRLYLRRQLDLKETRTDNKKLVAKGKEIAAAVNKANKEFKKRAKEDPSISPKTLARGKLIQGLVDEVAEKRLDAEGTKEILRILRGALVKTGKYSEDAGVAFGKKDFADYSRGLKSFTTLAFLSSPLSTVTQLGDFAYNLFENKQGAFQGDKDVQFDLSDINMATKATGFEFNSDGTIPGKLQKSIDFMFNAIGFRQLDESLKAKFLNSTYNRLKKQLGSDTSKSSAKVFDEISRLMGPERAQQVVDDIRAGKKSDIVAEFLFYKLSNIAPITKFDMPYWYLKNPNVRFLYALKSYTIKQLDYARRNVFKKIFSGNEDEMQEGLQNLFQMLTALMIANAPVEFIHAFLRKGSLPEMSDLTTENLWRLLGLNSYTGMIAKRDGVGSAAMGMVTPPLVSFGDAVSKDVFNFAPPVLSPESKSVRYIPIVGRTIYDWQDAFKEE